MHNWYLRPIHSKLPSNLYDNNHQWETTLVVKFSSYHREARLQRRHQKSPEMLCTTGHHYSIMLNLTIKINRPVCFWNKPLYVHLHERDTATYSNACYVVCVPQAWGLLLCAVPCTVSQEGEVSWWPGPLTPPVENGPDIGWEITTQAGTSFSSPS